MDQRSVTLSLFVLTVIVSGCTGGGGGQGTQDQGNQAVVVEQLEVTPTEIFEGGTVRVRMAVRNAGSLPAQVSVGTDDNGGLDGSDVLTNHCPDIFDITDFSASSSNVSGTEPTYTLAPDYRIRMNWELTQNTGNVPLNGYDCSLRFQVPFDYSVEAFRQIQVKDNSEVQGTEELFAKSSRGPMKIELQTIGSSAPRGAPTFLEGDNAEVLVQLENKKPDDSSYTGTVELQPPIMEARNLEFAEVNVSDSKVDVAERIARRSSSFDVSDVSSGATIELCPNPADVPADGDVRIYEDKSKVYRCTLDWDLEQGGVEVPSIRGEVFARANYTYVKSVGSRSVRVKYRGR